MTYTDLDRFVPHNNVREGRVGSLWIEVNSCGKFLMVYERDPERDPETHYAKLKDIEHLGLDSVNALSLLDFLKRWEPALIADVAEKAKEARQR